MSDEPETAVRLERTGTSSYVARNSRGGEVHIRPGDVGDGFTPVELLLAAVGGCSAQVTDRMVSRRISADRPVGLRVERIRTPDEDRRVSAVRVTYDVDLDLIADPDERERFAAAMVRAIESYCTVSRSLEQGTPVSVDVP